jgi:hypothetical protein
VKPGSASKQYQSIFDTRWAACSATAGMSGGPL